MIKLKDKEVSTRCPHYKYICSLAFIIYLMLKQNGELTIHFHKHCTDKRHTYTKNCIFTGKTLILLIKLHLSAGAVYL